MLCLVCISAFTVLWAISADDKHDIFPYFFQKTGFGSSCKLSPLETICMKCQNMFSGKKCRLLKFLPSVLSLKRMDTPKRVWQHFVKRDLQSVVFSLVIPHLHEMSKPVFWEK